MLSQRIRELRVAQGYSQVTLAKRLGVSKQAVSNWENDNIQPSIEMLLRLAQLFSVSTDYLLGRETHGLMNYPFRTAALAWLLAERILQGRGLPVLTKALRTVFPLAVLAGICYNFCVYFAAEPQLMGQNPALYENVSRLVQFWL